MSLEIVALGEDSNKQVPISTIDRQPYWLLVGPKPINEMSDEEILSNKELLLRVKKLLEAADNAGN